MLYHSTLILFFYVINNYESGMIYVRYNGYMYMHISALWCLIFLGLTFTPFPLQIIKPCFGNQSNYGLYNYVQVKNVLIPIHVFCIP